MLHCCVFPSMWNGRRWGIGKLPRAAVRKQRANDEAFWVIQAFEPSQKFWMQLFHFHCWSPIFLLWEVCWAEFRVPWPEVPDTRAGSFVVCSFLRGSFLWGVTLGHQSWESSFQSSTRTNSIKQLCQCILSCLVVPPAILVLPSSQLCQCS